MMQHAAGESIHLTSTHRPFDTRVFQKECRSLAKAGYRVTLIVPHTQDEVVDGVQIRAVPRPANGRERLKKTTRDVYKAALKENRDAIFHFHDGELLPFMLLLKLRGRRVIYDAHEDSPRQMMYQHWIPRPLRRPIGLFMRMLEWAAGRMLNHVIAAEPIIADYFPQKKVSLVRNYPMLEEFSACKHVPYASRPSHIGFAGGISAVRGVTELVDALNHVEGTTRLQLAGTFYPTDLKTRVENMPGWAKVDFQGWIDRTGLIKLLSGVRIGVITRHPIDRHLSAFPTKLFEYMAAGLPVVVSDLPTIRPIVERHNCGLLVDPLKPEAIATGLQTLLNDPEKAEQMGQRGYKAITEHYNWDNEVKTLLAVYQSIEKDTPVHRSPAQ
ncbi:MAG: glycosyltransferase family 4 protein [Bacteroidota bacterium]